MNDGEFARWIGREQQRTDWITPSRIAAWNATLDHDATPPRDGDPVPPGFHWTLFPPLARDSELAEDGHARTGGFLPPTSLPRRMWAGSRLVYHRTLTVGERVEQRSVVADIREKESRSGRLVFVTVHHAISGPRGIAIEEDQDIVYRGVSANATTPAPQPDVAPDGMWSKVIHPTEVLLFRYSALTFNGHRIHYDRRYAQDVEGYPGLVVHGPLIATLLLDLLRHELPESTVERFQFKAIRPTFDISPFSVQGKPSEPGNAHQFKLWSTSNRAEIAVEAEAWVR